MYPETSLRSYPYTVTLPAKGPELSLHVTYILAAASAVFAQTGLAAARAIPLAPVLDRGYGRSRFGTRAGSARAGGGNVCIRCEFVVGRETGR